LEVSGLVSSHSPRPLVPPCPLGRISRLNLVSKGRSVVPIIFGWYTSIYLPWHFEQYPAAKCSPAVWSSSRSRYCIHGTMGFTVGSLSYVPRGQSTHLNSATITHADNYGTLWVLIVASRTAVMSRMRNYACYRDQNRYPVFLW